MQAPTASLASVLELDAQLLRLAQGLAGLRLQLGEALELLVQRNGLFELGYHDLPSYALQRCSRSIRWAQDTRAVACRLSALPGLRAALLAGQVNWSMAELVSRHASPETDAQLSQQAKQLTVRQMRALLRRSASCAVEGEPEAAGPEHAPPGEAQKLDASRVESHPLFVPGGDGEPTMVSWQGPPILGDPDEADPVRTLTFTLDCEVAWLLEATRILVGQLGGQGDTESWVEAVLAEALTSLPERFRGELGAAAEAALDSAWLEQRARWRDEAEARCEHNFAELPGLGEQPPIAIDPKEPLGDSPGLGSIAELDRWIASAAERLASADLHLARLAERMHALEGWRRLGFASETQYARGRLGMSSSSLRAKRALERQLGKLPRVRRAVERGAIGFEAAVQLARVVTEQTEEQWVERARRRTAKHLREEVELAEIAARRTGQRALPPTEEQMQAYFELQQAVTSGRALLEAAAAQQRRGGSDAARAALAQQRRAEGEAALAQQGRAEGEAAPGASAGAGQATSAQRQMSASAAAGKPATSGGWHQHFKELAATVRAHLGLGREGSGPARAIDELAWGVVDRQSPGVQTAGSGRVTLRLRVRESLARLWRSVEREAMRSIPRGMGFVEYACLAVWSSWWHVLDPRRAYAHIYARDRYRCRCPVCFRRDVTPHHVHYRSRGGDDSSDNVAAICTSCHLELIHGGAIEVQGPASRLSWRIGRRRSMVVDGRELVLG